MRTVIINSYSEHFSLCICGSPKFLNALSKGVSKTAVYDKLNRLEPNVSKALVKSTAIDLATIIEQLGAGLPEQMRRISIQNSGWEWSGSHRASSVSVAKHPSRTVTR